MIRILLADDEALVRQGIRLVLESAEDCVVVGEVPDGSQVVEAVRAHKPDIVIVDIRMPRVDGLRATRLLTGLPRRPRVIVLTAFSLDDYLFDALEAGADGFVLKDASPYELIFAVRAVAAGDALISPAMTRRLIERYASSTAVRGTQARDAVDLLSDDHRHTLFLIARGLSNAQMGVQLGMTESRVKAKVSEVLRELGVANRVQAATIACTAGMLDRPAHPSTSPPLLPRHGEEPSRRT
ncbi:response regulator transcription factor [Streptomyces sp. MZ04]|uniref:response regulator transcription factor n=1 Tax=Streptomyces sp. MZ04 TaxID=2559236 RepID=UPI00107ECD49|nr:response regulator transcription factor [Streptomyces sp. MZ04]TGB08254.1 response regulator transcription factor [Streptomyces sp. MZ04]